MSPTSPDRSAGRRRADAAIFAALGDATRLSIVARLAAGRPCSISKLTRGTRLTRQAVTKHLRVLHGVGIVRSTRTGREKRYALDPVPLEQMRDYLSFVSEQWDHALGRLKSLVEE